jgi:hypothetical protein
LEFSASLFIVGIVGNITFDFSKMRAIFKSIWVRKLIGKLGVPYNRRLRVRGSPHPLYYDADLSLPAADSNAFRIHADLPCPERFTAAITARDSSGANLAPIRVFLVSPLGSFGRPIFGFINCLTKCLTQRYISFNI